MNIAQTHRAMETLEDVYADGDAVVVSSNRVSVRKGERGVIVTGHGDGPFQEWWPLAKLTAREDV